MQKWVRFDVTCSYDGDQEGPAIIDASKVVCVERRWKKKNSCVEICLDSGSSILVMWDFNHVIDVLGISEATSGDPTA